MVGFGKQVTNYIYHYTIVLHSFIKFVRIDTSDSVCYRETDADWNITWPLATRGELVLQKCPGGAESIGMLNSFMFL